MGTALHGCGSGKKNELTLKNFLLLALPHQKRISAGGGENKREGGSWTKLRKRLTGGEVYAKYVLTIWLNL